MTIDRMRRSSAAIFALATACALALSAPHPLAAGAERPASPAAAAAPAPAAPVARPVNSVTPHGLLPADSVTQHEIVINNATYSYTATAGTLPLTDDKGQVAAQIFYVSFMLDNVSDLSRRPITYLFNGGPGAASDYLDIGAIGPRALDFGPNGTLPPPVDHVVDNPDTWLPFTDLVFIDPVGTGYSRATGGTAEAARDFWTVGSDIDALGNIIRLHLTKSGRTTSPVYIVGESYGGFRAAELAYQLPTQFGIAPDGIVMISPVIDFSLMTGGPLSPLPYALRLPSYAAAELGAKSLTPNALSDAERFAMHDYLTMLTSGPRTGAQAQPLYQKLARLTGLDIESLERWGGLIPIDAYVRDRLRDDGRVVSRYDTTVSSADPDPWSNGHFDDPVLDRSIATFTSAFVAYARQELEFKTDRPYDTLNMSIGEHWNWRSGRGGTFRAPSASEALRRALALEPHLRVMIAHGATDIQTPYMMSRYIKEHMPASLGGRITLKLYQGGHMVYLHEASRSQLRQDAQAFYAIAAGE